MVLPGLARPSELANAEPERKFLIKGRQFKSQIGLVEILAETSKCILSFVLRHMPLFEHSYM